MIELNIDKKIFKKIAIEKLNALKKFQQDYPPKKVKIDNIEWEYIANGNGMKSFILLPGGMRHPLFAFELIREFEKYFNVISPIYP